MATSQDQVRGAAPLSAILDCRRELECADAERATCALGAWGAAEGSRRGCSDGAMLRELGDGEAEAEA